MGETDLKYDAMLLAGGAGADTGPSIAADVDDGRLRKIKCAMILPGVDRSDLCLLNLCARTPLPSPSPFPSHQYRRRGKKKMVGRMYGEMKMVGDNRVLVHFPASACHHGQSESTGRGVVHEMGERDSAETENWGRWCSELKGVTIA